MRTGFLAGPVGLAETVVAVETHVGITGYGQGGTPDLLRYAASLLIGEDPARTEYHWQRMYRSSIYPAGRERLHAVGALDCALWDIKGKLLGVPVYELLGGRARDYVECYKSYGALRVEEAREEGRKTMAEGFRAIRFHAVGGSGMVFDGRRAIGEMAEICSALREGVGAKGEFILDAHTRFSLADAVHALFAYPGQAMNEVFRPTLPPYLREAYLFREGKMFRSELPGLGVVVDESKLNAVAVVTEARPPELYQSEPIKRPDGSHLYL